MKIASLQPFFLPWIGVFNQIYETDIFVMADNLQYEKKSWINRNRIKNINGGYIWLTVPVKKAPRTTPINKIEIDNSFDWRRKHLKSIEFNYKNTPYFKKYFPDLKRIYQKEYKYIIELNIEFMNYFINIFGLNNTTIKYESNFNLSKEKNSAIIDLCKLNKADVYFSGPSAKNYLNYEMFEKEKIKIQLQNCCDIEYSQIGKDWIPRLSIIDTLFMLGKDECKNMIKMINKGDL